ncbi:hypothetical protein ACFO3U_09335 [Flavobacterium ponti]|uniref:DNA topoisomerase IV n=1 Tax=Flavobacterium ponti TaxID=665133 RepID=A0ABV9P3R0_9FLAO
MKKIVLLFVVTLGFSSLSYSQNCKNYKNGKFKLQDDELGVTYIIERKGNLQTERKLGEDTVLDFEVIWIDDCTYTLKSSEKTAAFLKSNVDLIVKIKDISGDFLELEMHMKDYPQSKISTIVEVIN